MQEAPKSKTLNILHDHYNYHDLEEKNKNALQFIEDVTANADEIQRRVLTEILARNANVEYLRRHNLGVDRTDQECFKKAIPVVTYEDLLLDIERIANGDKSPILCSHPISEFFTSSGTSGGERKLIPATEEEQKRRFMLYSLVNLIISQYFPGIEKTKGMFFLFIKSEATTPGGLLARPVLTSYYKSKHFKENPFDLYKNNTSPNETILCLDSYQSMYSQMLCGLCQNKDVIRVGSVFASGLIRAIKFLETHWKILCHDIRTGSIDPKISDPNVSEAVKMILKPDPDLADFIECECKKESWKGIITRIWPNAKFIQAIVTGTMAQYTPTLDYYSNGLPIVCTIYGSSECYFGLNLTPLSKPTDVCYTILPTMAYFEFMPVNRNGEVEKEQELIDLVDVKLGQEYELIITTYSGLYRYRVGDILRVSGFKNKAPQFAFICRENVALSIDSDKTNEMELTNAVKNAVNHLIPFNASLFDYTSYVDTSTIPGHYVLFWEIIYNNDSTKIPITTFEDCCYTIEESLNSVYCQGRASDKSIGPLEIRVVENGTFDILMDYAISQYASIGQYKTPRCVKYGPIIELLNSRIVFKYFSQKDPSWIPGKKEWAKEDK